MILTEKDNQAIYLVSYISFYEEDGGYKIEEKNRDPEYLSPIYMIIHRWLSFIHSFINSFHSAMYSEIHIVCLLSDKTYVRTSR